METESGASTAGRRVAFILGGTGGIGAASARSFAGLGYDVALTYRSRKEFAVELARELTVKHGVQAVVYPVEFRDADSIAAAVSGAATEFGRIDSAVYGGGPWVEWEFASRITPQAFTQQLLEDAVPFFSLIHAVIPQLQKTRGSIVAISTTAVTRTIKRDVLAAAPKATVELLVRNVALEEARFGVRANCVSVGPISGGVYHELVARGHYTKEIIEDTKKRVPLGTFGTEQDVANAVVFLATEKAGWITGQTLHVDGGYSL